MMPLFDFDTFVEQPAITRLLPDTLPNFGEHLEALGGTYYFYPIKSKQDLLMDHSGLVMQKYHYRHKTLELLCNWAGFHPSVFTENSLKATTKRTRSNLRRHAAVVDLFNQFILACEKKLFKFHVVDLRTHIIERMTKTSVIQISVEGLVKNIHARLEQFESDFYCREIFVSPLKIELRLISRGAGVSYFDSLSGTPGKLIPAIGVSFSRINNGRSHVRPAFYFSESGIYIVKNRPIKNVKETEYAPYTLDLLKGFSAVWGNSVAKATDPMISSRFVKVKTHTEFLMHCEAAQWSLVSALAQDKKHVSVLDLCFAFAFLGATKKHSERNLFENVGWRLVERTTRYGQV